MSKANDYTCTEHPGKTPHEFRPTPGYDHGSPQDECYQCGYARMAHDAPRNPDPNQAR